MAVEEWLPERLRRDGRPREKSGANVGVLEAKSHG
jgi:hypothetical protein